MPQILRTWNQSYRFYIIGYISKVRTRLACVASNACIQILLVKSTLTALPNFRGASHFVTRDQIWHGLFLRAEVNSLLLKSQSPHSSRRSGHMRSFASIQMSAAHRQLRQTHSLLVYCRSLGQESYNVTKQCNHSILICKIQAHVELAPEYLGHT